MYLSSVVNQTLPSGPGAMFHAVVWRGTFHSVMTPLVVIRPTLWANVSANHTFPSHPEAIPITPARFVGTGNSFTRTCRKVVAANDGEDAGTRSAATAATSIPRRRCGVVMNPPVR